ncbi:MAG TPA: VWA domain-containing protein [Burkholderiales bacterium]|jgi:Ca-activated chloride channel family protein|nr:VWA domain-containing protein [Burkholderiales bacterium]
MSFQWPEALWLLLLVPLLVAAYLWILRRKSKAAVRYASLGLVREAMGVGAKIRRHIPPALFLVAVTLLILASARPMATVTLPMQKQTIILALDASGSMRAKDVEPSRLLASQAAAKQFIQEASPQTRIGLVVFAGTAQLVQPPTEDREALLAAIDRMQLQRATATGSALIVSLATLFPEAGFDVSTAVLGRESRSGPIEKKGEAKKKGDFKPVEPGSYSSAVIIMMTDGQRTTGPDPIDVAKLAAERGVRVYTVGFGTTKGEVIGFEGWSFRVRLDEDTLKQVATMTRGEYFYAGTAADLKKVYQSLNSRLSFEKRETEVTALVSAVAGVFTLLAGLLSLLWFNRIL